MSGWEEFRFYHGQLTGHRITKQEPVLYEILPINGRPGYEIHADGVFIGETFDTVEAAKEWLDT